MNTLFTITLYYVIFFKKVNRKSKRGKNKAGKSFRS